MREIKFRAWHNGTDPSMLFVGDDYGTTHSLDCCKYFMERQPVILMQYTGLKDVNGVELYEGDLYLHWGNVVKADYYSVIYDNMQCTLLDGDFEIIGNIYENPELLEGDS